MSLLVTCPNCGPREVAELRCAGESTRRPTEVPTQRELNEYVYFRRNVAGVQREWWHHRFGCETWFLAERDTRTNEVLKTELPPAPDEGGAVAPEGAPIPDTPAV